MEEGAKAPAFPQLVTASFTVTELAHCSAGLIASRRTWSQHFREAVMVRNEPEQKLAKDRIKEITELLERISGLTTPEQKSQEMRDNG